MGGFGMNLQPMYFVDGGLLVIGNLLKTNQWVQDDERTHCNVCVQQFLPFRRRHHCRTCGEVVCNGCSNERRIHLTDVNVECATRVCTFCILRATDASINATEDSVRESISFSVQSRTGAFASLHQLNHQTSSHHQYYGASPTTTTTTINDHNPTSGSAQKQQQQPPEAQVEADAAVTTTASSASSAVLNRHMSMISMESELTTGSVVQLWPNPVFENESSRLALARNSTITSCESDATLNLLVGIVARTLESPAAFIGILDQETLWFKASLGFDQGFLSREDCCWELATTVVVGDTNLDKHFHAADLKIGRRAIRFLASTPLRVQNHVIGAIGAVDFVPRETTCSSIKSTLGAVANIVSEVMEQRIEERSMMSKCSFSSATASAPVAPAAPTVNSAASASASSSSSSSTATTTLKSSSSELKKNALSFGHLMKCSRGLRTPNLLDISSSLQGLGLTPCREDEDALEHSVATNSPLQSQSQLRSQSQSQLSNRSSSVHSMTKDDRDRTSCFSTSSLIATMSMNNMLMPKNMSDHIHASISLFLRMLRSPNQWQPLQQQPPHSQQQQQEREHLADDPSIQVSESKAMSEFAWFFKATSTIRLTTTSGFKHHRHRSMRSLDGHASSTTQSQAGGSRTKTVHSNAETPKHVFCEQLAERVFPFTDTCMLYAHLLKKCADIEQVTQHTFLASVTFHPGVISCPNREASQQPAGVCRGAVSEDEQVVRVVFHRREYPDHSQVVVAVRASGFEFNTQFESEPCQAPGLLFAWFLSPCASQNQVIVSLVLRSRERGAQSGLAIDVAQDLMRRLVLASSPSNGEEVDCSISESSKPWSSEDDHDDDDESSMSDTSSTRTLEEPNGERIHERHKQEEIDPTSNQEEHKEHMETISTSAMKLVPSLRTSTSVGPPPPASSSSTSSGPSVLARNEKMIMELLDKTISTQEALAAQQHAMANVRGYQGTQLERISTAIERVETLLSRQQTKINNMQKKNIMSKTPLAKSNGPKTPQRALFSSHSEPHLPLETRVSMD